MSKKSTKSAAPPSVRETPPAPEARPDVVAAVAAIDVGSNAMRLVIANVSRTGEVVPIASPREAVRLGRDAFTAGMLGEETVEKAIAAFGRFKDAIVKNGVRHVRAVATSALREAHNRDVFVDRVANETGIDVQIIGGEEEARLVSVAVSRAVDLRGRLAMLIDIGGGSVEVTLLDNGEIFATQSFRMGTVRLLERFGQGAVDEQVFHQQVREYVELSSKWLQDELGDRKVDLCVGTGGNCEALADLAIPLGGSRFQVPAECLDTLVTSLLSATFEERMQRFGLRPDRADVIVPAALVLQPLLRRSGADRLSIPRVGLKDGLLAEMVSDLFEQKPDMHRDQVLASALQFGRRYQFDELHGSTVRRLATELFDKTHDHHRMGEEDRMLLEVAALLHDVGQFVNNSGHHKHAQYLIMSSRLVGLSEVQRGIIGNVARYHRKSDPTVRHEPYRLLQPRERVRVKKLAAILRLADALDAEHAGKVTELRVDFKRPRLHLRIRGEGDLLLEKWAVGRKAPLFEEVFGVEVTIE